MDKNQQTATMALLGEHDSGAQIRLNLEIITNAIRLGGKGAPQRFIVPIGRVIVLSCGSEFADAGGLPEVYLAGERVALSPLRGSVPCWALEFLEFPGKVEIEASQFLPAISRDESDLAHLHISFYIRLHDPVLLLRRMGGKWEREEDRAAFNQRVIEDLQAWLKSLLEKDLQIWSDDESVVLERLFSSTNDYLSRIGLRIDTTAGEAPSRAILFMRRYPSALYDLAFQFAKAERLLRHQAQQGASPPEVGLPEEAVRRIVSSEERAGVALFQEVVNASPPEREQVARWMEQSAVPDAARFIKTLYKTFSEREIRLSEQVLLSAIRNPWLARGEWLRDMSESPDTRFRQIERRIKSLASGS